MGDATDLVIKYFEALGSGDVEAAVQLVAEDSDFRTPMGVMSGRAAIVAYLSTFETAFPRATYDLAAVIEQDGKVAAEGTYRATHRGSLALPDGSSLDPTGREVAAPFVTMFDVVDGAIVAHRPYWDLAGFMAQLTS